MYLFWYSQTRSHTQVLQIYKTMHETGKSYMLGNPQLIIDSTGRNEQWNCFASDYDASADKSCSLVWRNNLYFFGGFVEDYSGRTISVLKETNLEYLAGMNFDFLF